MKLKKGDPDAIKAAMTECMSKRSSKQPLEYPSAGSTFKRPEGMFAGKLIMDAGLAGYSVGGAQVSEKHCGFVINKGGATSAQIRELIGDVQKKVFEDTGVRLEREVIFLGEF
jgi:UDP-N-acetylmuramate dehydrogenase